MPLPNGASNINYNEANQMLSFQPEAQSTKNMTYDENGNMTSVTNSCGTTTYNWDVRNRLIGISGFNTDCSALSASFKYDALGRRIEKTINGVTKQYLYDGIDIVQEIKNSVVFANYIRTLNIDEPLARIKGTTVRYYQTDALGSVIALTDKAGAIRTTYSYDPFGAATISGEASDNPFQYTGRENDGSGLYYYRARYYSPELQRFISEDPIGLEGEDINFYAYVWNDPINWIDPEGLKGRGGGGRGRSRRGSFDWKRFFDDVDNWGSFSGDFIYGFRYVCLQWDCSPPKPPDGGGICKPSDPFPFYGPPLDVRCRCVKGKWIVIPIK